jgi:hypothetical protein
MGGASNSRSTDRNESTPPIASTAGWPPSTFAGSGCGKADHRRDETRAETTLPWGHLAFGYLSHLFGDVLHPLICGDPSALRFLAWPVVPAIEYDHTGGFLAFLTSLDFGVTFRAELGLVVVALGVWYADGRPGLDPCREQVSRWLDATRISPR